MQLTDIKTALGMEVKLKALLAGEAHALWNFLNLRYLYYEMTEIFLNYIQDSEFKLIVSREIHGVLQKQIAKVEELHKVYQVIMPAKPPKGVNTAVNAEQMRDEMMFRILLVGIQYFLETHAETLRMMSSDALRNLFMGWMDDEMKVFDNVIKHGKVKGWYWGAPSYQQ